METFPVTHFKFATRYPESGVRMQLGSSYMHTAPPSAPDQRTFILTITGMQYFLDAQDQLTTAVEPYRNMLVLENFYNQHKTAFSFLFSHPVYGSLTCKFARPLEIPEGVSGGNGLLQSLTLELLEIP